MFYCERKSLQETIPFLIWLILRKHQCDTSFNIKKNFGNGLLGFCTILFANYLLSTILINSSRLNHFGNIYFIFRDHWSRKSRVDVRWENWALLERFIKKYFPFVYAERLTCIYRTISYRLTLKDTYGTTWAQSEGLHLFMSKYLKALNH